MIYVRQPTEEEQRELKVMTRRAVGRVSQRAQIVLLSAQRTTVPQIATIFQVSRPTVRFWIRRFNAQGPAGLYDEERSGRPRKVTPEAEETLRKMICADPATEGFLATCWTVMMLVAALLLKLKTKLSPSVLRQALHRIELHWGRPRLGMPEKSDPEKAQKQWAIAKAVVEASEDTVILYADESRLQLLPLLRAMWHWAGQQIRVPTPGTNQTRALFGALNIRNGQWTYLIREKMSKEHFVAFLEHLLLTYADSPIILIVDNFSSHTARIVGQWLEAHPRLKLHYLPLYCSHLNPVEPIWLRLKDKVEANRLYGSMQLLLDTVSAFFREMTAEKALVWAGIKC
jgi:transposase